MILLVTGGSGSGKSAYAEDRLKQFSGEKYYIATMQIFDEEGKKKVERHRKMREGKGFHTVELPVDVGSASVVNGKKASALLECMSNLTANEMFSTDGQKETFEVIEKIERDIRQLAEQFENLIIVTNNVFEDGILYDPSTMEYIKALGKINEKIAQFADSVIEVVVGIPVVWKEQA